MRQDEYDLALKAATAEAEARVFSTLDELADVPALATELGEAHLQIVRDRFEANFATDGSEDEDDG